MNPTSVARSFETLGVIVRQGSERQSAPLQRILAALARHGRLLVHTLDDCGCIDGHPQASLAAIAAEADLAISVGGDGTLLAAARALVDSAIPLVGINLGRLGFLADVTLERVERHLDGIFSGHYSMEQRFLLEGSIETIDGQRIQHHLALNDIVLHTHECIHMIDFEVFSNDCLINRQRSDGLIVSTPTGSTAYALSGGGPIMHPALEAIALVPICPHTLSHRPIVLPSDQQIEIHLSQPGGHAQVSFDGHNRSLIKAPHRLCVRRYRHTITLLHPKDYDYYHILRAKLNWSNHP